MATLIIATRNAHKVREIAGILGASVTCLPMTRFDGVPELVENGASFRENAQAKAEQLAGWLDRDPVRLGQLRLDDNIWVLADDSGLEVDVLNGAPGVHSARFAAMDSGASGNSSDIDNNAKLLRLLRDLPAVKQTARFKCVLALQPVPVDGTRSSIEFFEGTCDGHISLTPAGRGGFGYDPLFIPDGCSKSFAELDETEKNAISHRSRALGQLRKRLSCHGTVKARA